MRKMIEKFSKISVQEMVSDMLYTLDLSYIPIKPQGSLHTPFSGVVCTEAFCRCCDVESHWSCLPEKVGKCDMCDTSKHLPTKYKN